VCNLQFFFDSIIAGKWKTTCRSRGCHGTWWAPWDPASGSAQQDVALTGEASKEYDARNIFLVYVHETSAGHSTTSVVQKKNMNHLDKGGGFEPWVFEISKV
jgi:hypothetical protein